MVEDGTTLMKLQKIELGDGAIMDKRGTLKWSYITKLESNYQPINLGRFASWCQKVMTTQSGSSCKNLGI
jgi:hypothetical protein